MPRYWPILLALVLGMLAMLAGLDTGGTDFERWQMASRWTARTGFPFFIAAFTASSLVVLWPGEKTRALLRNRKWWGLAFAAAHTLHLYALTMFIRSSPDDMNLLGLAPGFAIYIVIYAMVATSWPWAYKALGRNWKRMHKTGIYIIWGIFTLAYLGKVKDPELRLAAVPLLVIALGSFVLRLAAWRKQRSKRHAGAQA